MSLLLALALAAAPYKPIEPTEVRGIAQQFATCVVKRNADLASTYVLDSSVWLEKREFRKLFDSGCVPTDGHGFRAISGRRQQMSFALAEALVRLRYPSASMVDVTSAAPLDHGQPPPRPLPAKAKPLSPETLADMGKGRAANQAISILGECIVRANPAAAYGLLLTDPGSDMEQRYLEALQPAAGSCVEKGASINLTKYSLRGTVALNLYRLAKAPRVAVQ